MAITQLAQNCCLLIQAEKGSDIIPRHESVLGKCCLSIKPGSISIYATRINENEGGVEGHRSDAGLRFEIAVKATESPVVACGRPQQTWRTHALITAAAPHGFLGAPHVRDGQH